MTVKALWAGAGLALAAGLTMGAAMKPNLAAAGDRPEGPQVVADWAQAPTGPFDDGGSVYAAYAGKIPDYVIGTDWKKALAWPEQQTAYVDARYEQARYDDAPAEPLPAAYVADDHDEPANVAPPAAATGFPSIDGGTNYARIAQSPDPAAAAPAPRFDADAPPEATGDTSPAEG